MPTLGQLALGTLHVVLASVVSAHVVLTKRDVRAAIGWTGLVWLAPIVGSVLYGLMGINRIRRQAVKIRGRTALADRYTAELEVHRGAAAALPAETSPAIRSLATLVGSATGQRLTTGNTVQPLVNGDRAFPEMLAAIDEATRSVALATYIFDRGVAAEWFVDALARAVARGVEVRVLIDGIGVRYSRPPITRALRRRGVRVALFLPSAVPVLHPYFNLRNHRKILVVDGRVGFCGGINIRDGCLLERSPKWPTQDLHFRIEGPVVGQLMAAFALDWSFAAKEQLEGSSWFPALEQQGLVAARGIPDGPDEDFETLLQTLLGALSQATRTIRLATPYFLPGGALIAGFQTAALRGVRVEIVLPERGNLRLVQWAMMAHVRQIIESGCRVYLAPRPFDHSKLLVIDGGWTLIGSANWDPRSLRLNFEFGVECYSAELARELDALLDAKIANAKLLTLADLDRRPLPIKLRDGVARLAQPYL